MPRGRARRSRATTRERIPHRQGDRRRPSQGTSRPTGNTGETREGNPIGSQRIHSTCSLPDFIFIIFESGGKGSLFCNGKKGADLTRHNLTIHPIPMICATNALRHLCSQKQTIQASHLTNWQLAFSQMVRFVEAGPGGGHTTLKVPSSGSNRHSQYSIPKPDRTSYADQ